MLVIKLTLNRVCSFCQKIHIIEMKNHTLSTTSTIHVPLAKALSIDFGLQSPKSCNEMNVLIAVKTGMLGTHYCFHCFYLV